MGEYFEYVNHDKRLLFSIGFDGCNNKFSGIGYNIGARAFCLLLTQSDHFCKIYNHTLLGSWIGDKVSCIGDESLWEYEYDSYRDITANIIVMLYQIDGAENLIQQPASCNDFFIQIGYLILTKQFTDILSAFEANFTNNWTKRYKDIIKSSYSSQPLDLVIID